MSTSTVYWTPFHVQGFSEMVFAPPEKVLPELNIPLFQETGLLKCPSFTGQLQNTYVVRSPYDIEIGWDEEQGIWRCNWGDERSNVFTVRSSQYQMFSFKISYVLTSDDENMKAELKPASYHNCEFTHKTSFISGELEIGRYCRATDCAFILKPGYKRVKIKIGDPLFYVTFKSADSIKKIFLKKFYLNNELEHIVRSVDDMKRNKIFTNFKLEDYYRMYIEGGYRKKTLKLIKENLLD